MGLDENALAALLSWGNTEESAELQASRENGVRETSPTDNQNNTLSEILKLWEAIGVNPANLEKFFIELSAVVDIPIYKLRPEADLVTDLELDTFRYYTIVVLAENLFHERATDKELLKISNLEELIKCFTV